MIWTTNLARPDLADRRGGRAVLLAPHTREAAGLAPWVPRLLALRRRFPFRYPACWCLHQFAAGKNVCVLPVRR